MIIDKLKNLVKSDFEAVNNLIIEKIQTQINLIEDLSSHIISSGGKRLRPLLVLLASSACEYSGGKHIALAAMIEFFHTATLLHDDVVDESTLRRGRETANEIWGAKASILVGDYLFTQSVKLMVDVDNPAILKLMADTSHMITCGEVQQLANRNNLELSIENYMEVIKAKTALLFAAAAAIGAHLTNREEPFVQALYNYGLYLGNAFQIIDDLLDYRATAAEMGKNSGDDLADGKATLPLIYAYQNANAEQKKIIENSLGKASCQKTINKILDDTNAVELSYKYAQSEADKALAAISVLPDNVYKDALIELVRFSVTRKH